MSQDFGFYGKGLDGYTHYNVAFDRNFKGGSGGGGGGKPSGGCGGCLTLVIPVLVAIIIFCLLLI